MAYDNEKLLYTGNGLTQKNTTVWQYTSSADTVATIEASGYFNPLLNANSDNLTSLIKPKDFIFICGSDGTDLVVVVSIDPIVVASMLGGDAPLYSGKTTWSGAGTSLAITENGVLATDKVIATIQTAPTQAAYLASANATTNTVTLTLSAANTSNNAVIAWEVFRASA